MAGKYFEELEVGVTYQHEITRTVSEMDNILFTTLTMNTQPLHLDEEFAKNSMYGQRLVNSIFTLGVVVGVTVIDLTQGTTLGNLGFDTTEFPNPVFHGDTIRVETEVVEKRESKSRLDTGIVWFEHRGFNQRDELICRCRRAGLMRKKPTA